MAFTFSGGGGGRGRRRGYAGALAEINVTPFVDVVLVLLIIFMLTAHVMEFGIEVDVPKVKAVRDSAKELPVVTITKDGVTNLNSGPININDLNAAIRQRFPSANAVYVRADKDTVWNIVAQVMAELGEGKFQINMVTQPEDTAKGGK